MDELTRTFVDLLRPMQGAEKINPYTQLCVGQVVQVYASSEDVTDVQHADRYVGSVKVRWLDKLGPISGSQQGAQQIIPWTYPVFSNPILNQPITNTTSGASIQNNSLGTTYGFFYVPSKGDIVVCGFRGPSTPVVLGFLPQNLYKQQMTTGRPLSFGLVPTLVQGELMLQSQQQAQVYLDKGGAVQIGAKVQATGTNPLTVNPPTAVPTSTETLVTIGNTYTDGTFTQKVTSFNNKPVQFQIQHNSGAKIEIDSEGSIAINAAKDLALNAGGDYIHAASQSYTLIVSGQNGSVTLALNTDGSMVLTDGVGSTVTLDGAGTIGVLSPNGTGVNVADDNVQVATSGGTSVVVDETSQSVNVNAQNVVVNAGTVALGTGASDPVATANKLVAALTTLIGMYNSHTHVIAGVKAGPDTITSLMTPMQQIVPTPVQIASQTTIS